MRTLVTIAKNTLIETLRQPVYAVIISVALLLFLISPSLAMYTMDDDNKLLREIGLSTLFLASLFVAIFSASGAVAGMVAITPAAGFVTPLASLVLGVTWLVGLVIAYVYVGDAPEPLKSHYRFQIRTFWIGLLYSGASLLLTLVVVGVANFVLTRWILVAYGPEHTITLGEYAQALVPPGGGPIMENP